MSQIAVSDRKINLGGVIRAPERMDLVNALILMICQRASVFSSFPLGCVFYSAVCNPKTAYLSIPAMLVGALWAGAPSIKYVGAAVIMWFIDFIMPDKNKNHVTGAVVCAGTVFLFGIYHAIANSGALYGMSMLIGEALLCAVAYPVFANIKEVSSIKNSYLSDSKEYAVSVIALMATVLWGLEGINLPFSISIKSIVTIFTILCVTMYSSIPISVSFAALCGFISTPSSVDALISAGMLSVCAGFSGFLKYFGSLGAAIGFLTGVTVCVLFSGGTNFLSVSLADIFISALAFAAIPSRFYQGFGIFLANAFKPSAKRSDFRIKEYIVDELNCFSHTFSEFARQFRATFQKGTDNENSQASAIFDEVAERLCVSCNRCSDCWQKNFNDTYKYMFAILDTTEKTGHCDIHNAPIVFTQRCIQPDLFLNEFNHVYEMRKQELLRDGTRTGDRQLVSNQYKEISKIISELSEEIEGNFFFDEHKEKEILSECNSSGLFIRDINVVRNRDGYFEVFFAPGADADSEGICEVASNVLGMKMQRSYCKNKSIIKLTAGCLYDVNVAVFQRKKDNEPVSGDTLLHFKTDKNKYYIILCDGMGSGMEASGESKMTAELLGGFLKAGFSKETALSLINSTLALKMDREGFSTIDLCEIDLRSGNVEFVKVGGAQSYIKQNERYETLSATGLPAGILEDITTDKIQRQLSDGDMIVMVSDGVSEAGYGMMRGEWVKKLMRLEGIEENELAKSIVNSARKKIYPRTPDDMTAAVITVNKIAENEDVEEIDEYAM